MLKGVEIIRPNVHPDHRGWFMEVWKDRQFVQENMSHSAKGVLRGLHYQDPQPQGKLVSVPYGLIWDVVVDVETLEWMGIFLDYYTLLWVPAGYAHGFVVTSDYAIVNYRCDNVYCPECERGLRWDDTAIGIQWPEVPQIISEKDKSWELIKT